MIECPGCLAQLQDWAKVCQFCNSDVSKVPRPAAATGSSNVYAGSPVPKWIWGAYYGICVWWILSGTSSIFNAIQSTHQKFFGEELGWTFGTYAGVGMGVLSIMFAFGMMAKVEFIRGLVNFYCGLSIIFGLFGLAGAFIGALFSPWGLVLAAMQVVQIATSAFMIYLIGETEKYSW